MHVRLGGQWAVLCEGFRFRFPSHVAALAWLPSESSLDLCSEQGAVRALVGASEDTPWTPLSRFWRGLSGLSFRGFTHGTTTRASLSRQVRGGTKLSHPWGVPRQDKRLGLAEASRRPQGVE